MKNENSLAKALQDIGLELSTAFGSPMVPNFIRQHIGELLSIRTEEANKIASEADWKVHRSYLYKKLSKSLGLANIPERDSPLNVADLGSLDRDGYIIKKLTFEPLPGCIVPAHQYIPANIAKPAPAILFSLGHWIENAKMEPDQQAACIGLTKLGFIVLSYDPADQGERHVNWRCHNHLEAYLVGISQAGFNVWESIRAIDYLQSLPEVDSGRIGMTGASGGGHNTLYVSALDDRIKASVPVCYVNSFENLLQAMRGYNWVGGQDLCNQIPRILSYGDMGDIAALIAPRSLQIINAMQDPMFPIEGAKKAHARSKRIYDLLGASDRISLNLIDDVHSYNVKMRESAYGWFNKWLRDEGDGCPIPESKMTISPPRYSVHYITATADTGQAKPVEDPSASPETYCFPHNEPKNSWPAQIAAIRDIARSLPPIKNYVKSTKEWSSVRATLSKSIKTVVGPTPAPPPYTPGIVNKFKHGKYLVECVYYQSEEGITNSAMLYLNKDYLSFQPLIILVDYQGKRSLLYDGTVEHLLKLGFAVFTPDLRGTGATSATEFETATDSFMLDRDLFSQRLWDLLQAFEYMASYSVIGVQIDKHKIACVGRGIAGLLALYAGALDERIAAIGCCDAPVSYKEMIQEETVFPASAYIFNVLNHFEIEQVAAMAAPRPLSIVNPHDGTAMLVGKGVAAQSYEWCKQVYKILGASDSFLLSPQDPEDSVLSTAKWLHEKWSY